MFEAQYSAAAFEFWHRIDYTAVRKYIPRKTDVLDMCLNVSTYYLRKLQSRGERENSARADKMLEVCMRLVQKLALNKSLCMHR